MSTASRTRCELRNKFLPAEAIMPLKYLRNRRMTGEEVRYSTYLGGDDRGSTCAIDIE